MNITKMVVYAEVDGELCTAMIPEDRMLLAAELLSNVYDDGVLKLVRMPKDKFTWETIPLGKLKNE